MTIEERTEFLLKVQESHGANLNRVFELRAQNEQALGKFMSRTDEVLDTMVRILENHEHRLTDVEGGTR